MNIISKSKEVRKSNVQRIVNISVCSVGCIEIKVKKNEVTKRGRDTAY